MYGGFTINRPGLQCDGGYERFRTPAVPENAAGHRDAEETGPGPGPRTTHATIDTSCQSDRSFGTPAAMTVS